MPSSKEVEWVIRIMNGFSVLFTNLLSLFFQSRSIHSTIHINGLEPIVYQLSFHLYGCYKDEQVIFVQEQFFKRLETLD